MKQHYITLFNVHSAGKTTSQDADALQPFLRAASDEAFPVLMNHKPRKRTFIGWICWLVLLASAAHILFSPTNNFHLDLTAWAGVVVSSLTLILLPSLKKRTYKDYLTILEKYK